MTSIFDYEHLDVMLFVEPIAIVEHIPDKLPDTTLERGRRLKPHPDKAVAPAGACLTKET